MAAIQKDLWTLVAPALDEALELDPEGRARVVARLRETSGPAADELAAVLEAETLSTLELFQGSTGEALLGVGETSRSIDKYTLDHPIGRGGMGTVWLAHRSDGRFEGAVAIKLLNLALVGRAGEERFAQEGKVLARLAHPNIARLLDAGISGGQPFLVLEHIRGQRIDEFADQRRLSPDERIGLCLQVLDALATAHANLVIHRDIKPSNILVTPHGEVKLLDFGIAKLLLDGRPASEPTTLTVSAGPALTPEYAAPEVITGDPVSAATDVYSAGVLLYRLLAGRHPTGEGSLTAAAHLRAALVTEPLRLSEAAGPTGAESRAEAAQRAAARGSTPDRLRRFYRGDLDNVLAKALRKAPAERYRTAAELRDDLRRYLAHQPVSARLDSVGYRAWKFVRRNRRALAAGGLVAASLLGATGVSVHQVRIAERERDRARSALERSRATTAFESLLFRLIRPGGEAITYRQLLDRGREALEKELKADPIARLEVAVQFAQNYEREGDMTSARAVLARAVMIADSLNQLEWRTRARCELANAVVKANAPDSAAALIRVARGWLEQIDDPDQGTLDACDQAEGEWNLGVGRPDSAAAFYRHEVERIVAAGDSGGKEYVFALSDYTRALFAARRPRQVLPLILQLVELARSGATADPEALPTLQVNAFLTYELLGEPVRNRRYLARELAYGYRADTANGAEPALRLYYAQALESLDQPDSARYWYRNALEQPRRLGATWRRLAELRLARLARAAGDPAEAARHEGSARAAAAEARRTVEILGEEARGKIESLSGAGRSGTELEAAVRAALDGAKYREDGTGMYLIPPLRAAARRLLEAGRFEAAGRYADHLRRIGTVDSLSTSRSAVVGEGLLLGARSALGRGDASEARALARRAVAPLRVGLGTDHRLVREAAGLADSLGGRR